MNPVRNAIAKRMGRSADVDNSIDDEDDSPYNSIARPGADIQDDEDDVLEDATPSSAASSLSAPNVPVASQPATQKFDPMAEYNKQEEATRAIRQDNRNQNANVNIYRSLAQLAGSVGTAPVQTGLYDSMIKQNNEDSTAAASDLGRRASVMKAIGQAQSKQAALASREAIAKGQQDAANKRADDSLGAYKERTGAMKGAQDSRLDKGNITATNALFKDPNINKEVTKLNSARSAQTLIDSIRSGQLVDSKSVKNQLTNILTTIELGSPGGQGDRHNMGVDNLYSKVQDALSFVESNPKSSITPQVLSQIEHEAFALGDRAAKNYKGLTDASLSGADLSGGDPEADAGKIHALGKQRQAQFLKSAGYDPDSGNSLRAEKSAGKVAAGKPGPGSIIKVNGKRFKVAADGDSLEQIQ